MVKTVVRLTLSGSSLKPVSEEYVNNLYRSISANNCSKDERGQSETRVHLQSLAFFLNIKNKQHFFSIFVTYLCHEDFVQLSSLPILVNNENETSKI